jgi:hypothetical protein
MPDAKDIADRIGNHPMYSASDLKYLRKKGYGDEEILAFWDRDHSLGHEPVQHRLTYSGTTEEVVREVLKDNLSPQTVAWVAKRLGNQLWMGFPHDKKVAAEATWLVQRLEEAVGGHDAVDRLCQEIDN